MNRIICVLIFAATSVGFVCSSVFGPSSFWLRKPNSDMADELTRFADILRLRGGEDEKKETSEKIKGCCIGIDLGTTYRQESCSNTVIYSRLPSEFSISNS